MPKVSVLMAAYNAEDYLQIAVDSILSQTFEDFEFIIIDDTSTDSTSARLAAIDDPRVKVYRNPENLGLTKSLNVGMKYVTGEYVARMDADDVSHPERLQKQVSFLDAHPEYALVGSSYRLIDGDSKVVDIFDKAMDHEELMWLFHMRTALEHASVTFRHQMHGQPPLLYDERYRTAQDYDYWLRHLSRGKGAVLSDILLDYRVHDANVTNTLSDQQFKNLKTIGIEFVQSHYGLNTRETALAIAFITFMNDKTEFSIQDFAQAYSGMQLLLDKYLDGLKPPAELHAFLVRRAHSQLWFAALSKRPCPTIRKTFMILRYISSFRFALQRKRLGETFYPVNW